MDVLFSLKEKVLCCRTMEEMHLGDVSDLQECWRMISQIREPGEAFCRVPNMVIVTARCID